jgi:hypothetical protein
VNNAGQVRPQQSIGELYCFCDKLTLELANLSSAAPPQQIKPQLTVLPSRPVSRLIVPPTQNQSAPENKGDSTQIQQQDGRRALPDQQRRDIIQALKQANIQRQQRKDDPEEEKKLASPQRLVQPIRTNSNNPSTSGFQNRIHEMLPPTSKTTESNSK